MRFTIDQGILLSALQIVLSATRLSLPQKTRQTLFQGPVSLQSGPNGITLQAGGDSANIRIDVPACVLDKGNTVVAGRFLERVLRALGKSALSIESDEKRPMLSVSRGRCRAEVARPNVFPDYQIPSLGAVEGHSIEVEWPVFNTALRSVMFAVAGSHARPVLNGICVSADGQATKLVAVDGVRMAVRRVPLAGMTGQWVIPAASLRLAGRLFKREKVRITLGEGIAQFAGVNARVVVKCMEGQFPPYKKILAQISAQTTVTMDRLSLLSVVERLMPLGQLAWGKQNPEIHISTDGAGLRFSATNEFAGLAVTDELEAKIEGKPFRIKFNPCLLRDILRYAEGDKVSMGFRNAYAPVTFRGESEGWIAVLMPLRPSEEMADAA